jgi:outer membrane protein TolC
MHPHLRTGVAALALCAVFSPACVTAADTLTVRNAVALALQHSPALRSAAASVESANAGRTGALAAYYPVLSGSAGMTHTSGAFVFNPSFPPRSQEYNNYTAGFQISQTLFDFGKTISRVSASGDQRDAAVHEATGLRQTVIANVRLACYALLAAGHLVAVAEETHAQALHHLEQARAFFSVGSRPQFDVTRAEVEVANAAVTLVRARNQARLARVQLDNAMGVHPAEEYVLREEEAPPIPAFALDSAFTIALVQRPEYRAAQARAAAARALAGAAWSQHLPTLSATASYTWTAFSFPLYNRWTAGFTMTLPIFQGFGIDAQVGQADAAATIAEATADQVREAIRLDVEEALLALRESEERRIASMKFVEQATQNLNLAERQYAAGIGTAVEVADARVLVTNARTTLIQAEFDRRSAIARLEKAVGSEPEDVG